MKVLLLFSILVASVTCGHAITCTTCTETTSDDPNFSLIPAVAACSTNPGERVCDEGCMTMSITMEFTRDSGPLTLTQTQRSCGPPAAAGFPTGNICADQAAVDTLIATLPNFYTLFPLANLDVSLCTCDSSDKCTPPSPATGGGTQPVSEATMSTAPTITDVRLVGGESDLEGTIEIQYDGEWGTICDDSWDLDDAHVVCRMLDFDGASTAPTLARFGEGSGPILLDDVECSGDEDNLTDCPHMPFKEHNCGHSEDAGAICFIAEPTTLKPQPSRAITDIRLVGGGSTAEGRVEILYEGQWGTVCDDDWDVDDASVACRMLGFDAASHAVVSAAFGQGSGPILLDDMMCLGNEDSLIDCGHPPLEQHNCLHSEDAGAVCFNIVPTTRPTTQAPTTKLTTQAPTIRAITGIRLVGGSSNHEGRVEIRYAGRWGTICDDYWGISDAEVACRMLGFDGASEAVGSAHFGRGSGDIWLDEMRCGGQEADLEDCRPRPFGNHNCWHGEDAGVVCYSTHPDGVVVRLVNGSSKTEGRVEILYEGEFGTVCDDSWDINDANVICRMLGYEGASEAPGSARFGRGSGDIVMDDVVCLGSEENVASCEHSGWRTHNCDHDEDASVVCSGELRLPVRLVNGDSDNEGRVEIYRYGAWGSVCDHFWEISDGNVVCRMLGYQRASRIRLGTHYGPGRGWILLDHVECTGLEATLDDCVHRGWGVHDCDHYQDAGVVCA